MQELTINNPLSSTEITQLKEDKNKLLRNIEWRDNLFTTLVWAIFIILIPLFLFNTLLSIKEIVDGVIDGEDNKAIVAFTVGTLINIFIVFYAWKLIYAKEPLQKNTTLYKILNFPAYEYHKYITQPKTQTNTYLKQLTELDPLIYPDEVIELTTWHKKHKLIKTYQQKLKSMRRKPIFGEYALANTLINGEEDIQTRKTKAALLASEKFFPKIE